MAGFDGTTLSMRCFDWALGLSNLVHQSAVLLPCSNILCVQKGVVWLELRFQIDSMRRNATLIFLACAVLLIAGRSAADDVDEKDVVVLGDKNFTEGLKQSKFALVRADPIGSLPLTLMSSNRSGDPVFPCGRHRGLM